MLHSHGCTANLQNSSSRKTETVYPLNNNSPFLPPSAPGIHHSPFCLWDVTALGTSYEWTHTVFVCLCLALLRVHPCCGICQNFLPFNYSCGIVEQTRRENLQNEPCLLLHARCLPKRPRLLFLWTSLNTACSRLLTWSLYLPWLLALTFVYPLSAWITPHHWDLRLNDTKGSQTLICLRIIWRAAKMRLSGIRFPWILIQ